MAGIVSRNPYASLNSDDETDNLGNNLPKDPEPPTKIADKPAARVGKRDGPTEKPEATGAPRAERDPTRRRGGFTDGDRQFRDRTNRRANPNPNLNGEVVEGHEGQVRGRDSGPGTQRRGRGDRGPRRGGDRHSRTGQTEHQKQADAAWGSAETEQADEVSGEAQARAEITENGFDASAVPPPLEGDGPIAEEAAPAAPAEPAEPEDNSVSYSDYLVQKEAQKKEGLGLLEARKPNEGAKQDKKFENAKAFAREGEGESYFEGQTKAARHREREQKKQTLDIDYTFKEPPSERGGRGDRGDRGDRGGRGGRGRGRGDFGDRPPRGDRDGDKEGGYRGRGDREGGYRGRGRGNRGDGEARGGERRGGRGGSRGTSDAPALKVDENSFPSLGGK